MLPDRKGQALLIVLLLTTSILLVGGAAVTVGTAVRKNAAREVHAAKAYYIAEAGVERVLARARRDPHWLQALPGPGGSRDFIALDLGGQQAYAGGRFVEIKVYREDAGWNAVLLHIRSTGEYLGAQRTVNVDARVDHAYGDHLFRGLWVKALTGVKLSHGAVVEAETLASEGDVILAEGSAVRGDLFVRGNLKVDSRDNPADKRTVVFGNVWCVGDVLFAGEGATLVGDLYVQQGSIGFERPDGVNIGGTVYVRDAEQLPEDWRNRHPGKWRVDPSLDVVSRIPGFPRLLAPERLAWYRENADAYYEGDVTLSDAILQNVAGLWYIKGDLTVYGTYSGHATLVVEGNVTVGHGGTGLMRSDTGGPHCLSILTTGIIDTHNAQLPVEALLYSENLASAFQNGATVTGAVVTPNIGSSGREIGLTYDPTMVNAYEENLNWVTSSTRIVKWSE
ncbi:MAG: pilus assembly PilX N-terminal domain-containing protein [Firmicutes bacterium]|nr:pilus assembly PilX N-terminal domain-containing protein [Bacillota bacterium]